jgi:protein MpaA
MLLEGPLSSEGLLWKWQVIRELATEEFAVKELCREIDARYEKLGWGKSRCSEFEFKIIGWSVENRPLISFEAKGEIDEASKSASPRLTLLQCAIHGDELTAVPMCLMMIGEIVDRVRELPKGASIAIQPLLNPDGFLASKPQRPNARGVDLNRNFSTPEWTAEAEKYWVTRDRKDPRKFPGNTSNSEPETLAIVKFIEERAPQKIISIHTPLGFLELDSSGSKDKVRRAKFLAINMVQNAKNLDFKSYGIWPGSLGNYAGIHKKIPVYTLELPPGNSLKNKIAFWESYSFSLWRALQFDIETGSFHED